MSLRACLVPLAALVAGCSATGSGLRWDLEPDRSLALFRGGEEVWRLCVHDARPKPCFHPLALPGGKVLTIDAPKDHVWHHGLWFCWKLIDGVNYWEPEADGRPAGRTSWRATALEPRDDGSAHIVLALEYGPRDAAPVLRETRVLEVTAPAADGSFAIDHDGSFRALAACELGRTPPPGEAGGQVNGGYAGLAVRLVNLNAREVVSTDGPVAWNASDRARCVAAGFDYGGVLDGFACGIAVLDHPANPRAPSAWYAVRTGAMSFFNAALLVPGVILLGEGDELRLRYRVIVHPGRWDAARLQQAVAEYAAEIRP